MPRGKGLLGVLAFIGIITIFWSIADWITALALPSLSNESYFKQLIPVLLGFILLGLFGGLIGRIFGRKRMNGFYPIIDAIRQISSGNFKVKLDVYPGPPHHPFTELTSSINDMAKELGEVEQMRQTFISNVSHEIQSPLTSIRGFAHALHNEKLTSEDRNRYLHIIETESTRLSKLSDNLLKLTSLESEHHPFTLKEYRLDQQIKQVILASEPQWLAKNITIDLDLEEISISADQELLSQVWTNILHNSIKFTPDDGKIQITTRQKADEILITIRDTGIGISTEDQVHIFERFYKGDKSRNRTAGGSGLGLSIVKKIVELHKGNVEVSSTLGEGTTMSVTLPQNITPTEK